MTLWAEVIGSLGTCSLQWIISWPSCPAPKPQQPYRAATCSNSWMLFIKLEQLRCGHQGVLECVYQGGAQWGYWGKGVIKGVFSVVVRRILKRAIRGAISRGIGGASGVY